MSDIASVEIVDSVEKNAFITLYREAGWWREEYDKDPSFIDGIVSGSLLFAVAISADRQMVGMARAVSDGCSDAYIQDVVVARDFRGRGIGARLERRLIEELLKRGVDWIGLIAEPESVEFHRRQGFAVMEGHVPMLFNASEFRGGS